MRHNLELHAKLFDLPVAERGKRVDEMLDRFGLREVAGGVMQSLPLGIRQRLPQPCRVAIVEHRTAKSVVKSIYPVARSTIWEYLILSPAMTGSASCAWKPARSPTSAQLR